MSISALKEIMEKSIWLNSQVYVEWVQSVFMQHVGNYIQLIKIITL